MAEPKQRQRPKGAEIRDSLKSKDRLTDRDREFLKYKMTPPAAIGAGTIGSTAAADLLNSIDPYLSRNEFKPGFYDQKNKPPVDAETMFGKGTKIGRASCRERV